MTTRLLSYQSAGDYLFHGGSRCDLKTIKPSQAMSFGLPDGNPAVHASSRLEPAIFMAVLGSRKMGGWGMHGKSGFGFYILDKDLERAGREGWIGYVYVLPKDGFKAKTDWEWTNQKAVRPIDVIEVGIKDLPAGISVLSQEQYDNYLSRQK